MYSGTSGWVTAVALEVPKLSYKLMSVFLATVMRQKVHFTPPALHHQVFVAVVLWDDGTKNTQQLFCPAVARKRRLWFEGLWADVGEPV